MLAYQMMTQSLAGIGQIQTGFVLLSQATAGNAPSHHNNCYDMFLYLRAVVQTHPRMSFSEESKQNGLVGLLN